MIAGEGCDRVRSGAVSMNRRDILRTTTAGLLAAPAADRLRDAVSGEDSDDRQVAAAYVEGRPIDLGARGFTPGDVDTYAADNAAIWEQATTEAAAAGASLYLPGSGVYRVAAGLTLDENVRYVSDGATLKLADGANGDLMRTRGWGALWSTNRQAGPTRWSLEGFVLDGNAANQSADCHPLSIYGRDFTIDRVRVTGGKAGGIRSGWAAGGTKMESRLTNVTVYNNHRLQFDWRGPHDSQMSDLIVFTDFAFHDGKAVTGSRGIRFSDKDAGTQVDRLHVWGFHERGVEMGVTGTSIYNGVSEGAQVNVLAVANSCVFEGTIFGTADGTGGGGPYAGREVGFRVGVAGSGATHWNNRLRCTMQKWNAGDRPVDLVADNGNDIDVAVHLNRADGVVFGARSHKSSVNVMCPDRPQFSERMGGFSGVGAPNRELGRVGSLYTRLDGGTGSYLYRKTGSTTWTAVL